MGCRYLPTPALGSPWWWRQRSWQASCRPPPRTADCASLGSTGQGSHHCAGARRFSRVARSQAAARGTRRFPAQPLTLFFPLPSLLRGSACASRLLRYHARAVKEGKDGLSILLMGKEACKEWLLWKRLYLVQHHHYPQLCIFWRHFPKTG